MRNTTKEKFEKKLKEFTNDEFLLLSEYNGFKEPIKLLHKRCGYPFYTNPKAFKRTPKCHICDSSGFNLNNEEFVNKVKFLVGNEYLFLDEYIDTSTPINVIHMSPECEYNVYPITPNHFFGGERCPKCATKRIAKIKTKTTEEFKKEVYNLVGDEYEVLGEYINATTPIKMKHKNSLCGNEWETTSPDSFLRGTRCPKCFGTPKRTFEEIENLILKITNNEYKVLKDLGKIKNHRYILMRHNDCGYEWSVRFNHFVNGSRCPQCDESKGEKAISILLKNKNYVYMKEYKISNCKNERELPFDFAIIEDNILIGVIEFDGKQHFKIVDYWGGIKCLNEVCFRDNIKTTYCEENNIPLLRIKYNQIDIIEEILDDFLKEPNKYIINHFYNITKEEYYSELYENLEKEGDNNEE